MPSSKTFLVVDDAVINRMVVRILLQKNGHTVLEAEDGKDVIELIKEGNTYDIIWIDVNMPIIDGVECTQILRNQYNYKGVIIGITGYADQESYNDCMNVGMNDYIVKPIDEAALTNMITKYIK